MIEGEQTNIGVRPPGQMRANRFRQCERLRLRTLVEKLFAGGNSLYEWPLRAVVLSSDNAALTEMFRGHVPDHTGRLQMLVTVPKRRRRHAVDRVLMRRRVREAWRLQRGSLYESLDRKPEIRNLAVGFIYVADCNVDYAKVSRSVGRLIAKIGSHIDA